MGAFDNLLLRADESITGLFAQWNVWTSLIVTLFAGFLTYQISTRRDPDIHPFLLARQAQPSPVRQPGESPVYRSQAAPHGMPLQAGLNVKDPGASKWARGRDGDLRDIWRQVIAGVQEDGPSKGATGRILTVEGTEHVVEHNLADLTRQINLIGRYILDRGGNRVAIYLPNSVELLLTLFACSFYNLTAVILPFDQPDDAVISMLRRSAADTVVTAPGSFPFDEVVKHYPSLRQLIWVVDEGSKHMDWNEIPQGTGGSAVNVSTWQDIIADPPVSAGADLPSPSETPKDVTIFWQNKPGQTEDMVRFTSANLIAAVAAQLFAVPTARRMSPADLFLPADSLANTHTLALTLAALYSNASVAFNSSSPAAADLALATQGIAPTIVSANPAALLKTHETVMQKINSTVFSREAHSLQTSALAQDGVFAPAGFLANYYDSAFRPKIFGTEPGKLRLIFTAERVGAETPKLSSTVLSDLRVITGARVIYALTAANVAGAVAQTNFYDYRVTKDEEKEKCSHFGPPVTAAEVLLRDKGEYKSTDEGSKGEIIVKGPCVAGKEAALGVVGYIRHDHTLALI
ncbi:peroxisomal long chain acyl-CoA synthetase 7 [Podospora australis]|uniref:Peroxisomal long chain acyl-CoA synthetase 7 n=1 Tax=Podospora australis TaxID=1536484 RepID=A0AAN7AK54_9PEZI|nr:peroxisomal long chain acyl-CoA synthetase 7 [Podospora australis]